MIYNKFGESFYFTLQKVQVLESNIRLYSCSSLFEYYTDQENIRC